MSPEEASRRDNRVSPVPAPRKPSSISPDPFLYGYTTKTSSGTQYLAQRFALHWRAAQYLLIQPAAKSTTWPSTTRNPQRDFGPAYLPHLTRHKHISAMSADRYKSTNNGVVPRKTLLPGFTRSARDFEQDSCGGLRHSVRLISEHLRWRLVEMDKWTIDLICKEASSSTLTLSILIIAVGHVSQSTCSPSINDDGFDALAVECNDARTSWHTASGLPPLFARSTIGLFLAYWSFPSFEIFHQSREAPSLAMLPVEHNCWPTAFAGLAGCAMSVGLHRPRYQTTSPSWYPTAPLGQSRREIPRAIHVLISFVSERSGNELTTNPLHGGRPSTSPFLRATLVPGFMGGAGGVLRDSVRPISLLSHLSLLLTITDRLLVLSNASSNPIVGDDLKMMRFWVDVSVIIVRFVNGLAPSDDGSSDCSGEDRWKYLRGVEKSGFSGVRRGGNERANERHTLIHARV
ncbi:hypothetical protein BD410DRAFT_846115 [Rickenella mellea]|uniref:Uncharacterized protein n=1 Tax=Rickenella mellea TaxID=50990 RepID=A0A4Y7PG19_9AGAM|nr:hypothetical protein BD410DRAFT_846115 [Rickenella mellea]